MSSAIKVLQLRKSLAYARHSAQVEEHNTTVFVVSTSATVGSRANI